MKRFTILLLFSSAFCLAEEAKLTRSAILKGEHSIVALKKDSMVEVLSRDEKALLLTVRYGKVTGTIPMASITDAPPAAVVSAKKESSTTPPPPAPPPAAGKATTTYGKAVEKAKDNAAKHDKNLVRPTDEILK